MLSHKHIIKVISLGAPLLAGLISEFFLYIADSAMVGRLGTEHLAAIGIAVLFGEILWVMVWPIAPSTQTIAARRYGLQKKEEDDKTNCRRDCVKETGEVFDHAVIVALMAGMAAILVATFAETILDMLLDNPRLVGLANGYIQILKWIMPVAGVFYALYGFLAAVNLTRPIMHATIGLNVLNIILNYLLIFGKSGLPAMGITGAAISTVVSQAIGTLYLTGYLLFAKDLKKYRCFQFHELQLILIRTIARTAAPIILQLTVVFLIYLYYESLIAHIDTTYLAVTHIIFTIFVLKRTLVGGFAEGGSILIGNNLGRRDKKEALNFAYAVQWICGIFGFCLFLVVLLYPEMIVKIFNHDPRTVEVGGHALRFFSGFLLISSLAYPLEVIFTHNGWGRFVLLSDATTNILFVFGLTWVLLKGFSLGIYAAWLAFGIQIVFYAVFLFAGFFSKKWLSVSVSL